MVDEIDYRLSHTADGKGEKYDKSFKVNNYRLFILKWEQQVLKEILSNFIKHKGNYLDFACGTGRITKIIEDDFINSYGIDVSEAMLSEAKTKLSSTKIFHKDITKHNPFSKDQMDLITSFRFFLNAEPRLRSEVLIQLNEIINTEGYLVFNIHNNKTIISILLDRLTILKKRFEGKKFIPQNSLSIFETKALLKKHGFKIVKTYHKAVVPIKSENSDIKYSRFAKLENIFSRISLFKYLARNIIFVCKKEE